jgi:serine/threonine protein kinase
MAPEFFVEQQYSKATDIWALGTIIYELLFGYTPFMANNIKELHK